MQCVMNDPCCNRCPIGVRVSPPALPNGGAFTVTAVRCLLDAEGNPTGQVDASYVGPAALRVLDPTGAVEEVNDGHSAVTFVAGVATFHGTARPNTDPHHDAATFFLGDFPEGLCGPGLLRLPVCPDDELCETDVSDAVAVAVSALEVHVPETSETYGPFSGAVQAENCAGCAWDVNRNVLTDANGYRLRLDGLYCFDGVWHLELIVMYPTVDSAVAFCGYRRLGQPSQGPSGAYPTKESGHDPYLEGEWPDVVTLYEV